MSGFPGERLVPEAELVRRIAAGEPGALWDLWQRHRGELRGLCRRWMNGNPADAEDALSGVMLKARELLPAAATGITNLRTWLARLAHNHCMDLHRERRRQARLVDRRAERDSPRPAPASAPPTPEDDLFRLELFHHVRHAIDDLPAGLRQAVLLRFFVEMPHRDIAERLHLSSDNVRKRIQYARGILGTRLQSVLRRPSKAIPPLERPLLPAAMRRPPTGREAQRLATLRSYIDHHPRGFKRRLELAALLESLGEIDEAQRERIRALAFCARGVGPAIPVPRPPFC